MKLKKADIILILILALVAAAAGIFMLASRHAGGEVVVTIDGVETMRLPLDEDTEVLLGEGEDTNLLVIKDGHAAITEASCPDCVCVRTGEIQYAGQTIVCLPHKLVVSIEGGQAGEADATVQ